VNEIIGTIAIILLSAAGVVGFTFFVLGLIGIVSEAVSHE
jgi:hypothetical protein